MDNKTPSLAPLPSTPSVNPPPKSIDLTAPASRPASSTPVAVTPPVAQPETLAHSPVEHDIAAPSPLPSEQPLPAPVPASTPEVVSATPAAPTSAPAPTPPSSIPPMPSLDSMAPAAATPVPSATPAPVPDSVISVSTPTANSPTPPVGAEATQAPTVPATTGEASSSVAESKTNQPTPQKKSRTLVLVVLFLALVALALGGLVVWRATQPATRSIEESMTPPVVPGSQEVEEITEEEVIVEDPDQTADWEEYSTNTYYIRYPKNMHLETRDAGINITFDDPATVGNVSGISLTTHDVSSYESLSEWLEIYLQSGGVVNTSIDRGLISDSSIDGSPALKIAPDSAPENISHTVYLTITDEVGYAFILSPDVSKPTQQQILDQILNSFSFNSENLTNNGAALQGSCTQDDMTYADGDAVPAPDSCNSCSCDNGQIACTAMACEE